MTPNRMPFALLIGALQISLGSVIAASPGHQANDCVAPEVQTALKQLQRLSTDESPGFAVTRDLVLNFGPRPAGSLAEKAAAEWAVVQLTALGLDSVQSQPFEFEGWQRGTAELTVLGVVPIVLRVAALGGSTATSAVGIEAPVVRFTSLAELDAAPPDTIKNRIVFLDGRMRRTRDRSGYKEAAVIRRDGGAEVARRGGLALVIRSIGTDHERAPHVGWSRAAADVPRLPAVALSIEDADFLADYLEMKGEVKVRLYSSAQAVPSMTSQNVFGQLTANPVTADTVLMGAHLDSWDLGMGAEDDGVGVGVVVSAMQRLVPYRALLRRNVRVVLFGNEEQGGVGAKVYAERTSASIRHVLAVESDLGSGRVWRLQIPDPAHPRPIDSSLARALKPLGITLSREAPAFGGTDIEPLAGSGTALYDLDPDASDYFDIHHTERDMLGHVSSENMDQQSRAFAILALLTATAPNDCMAAATTPGDAH